MPIKDTGLWPLATLVRSEISEIISIGPFLGVNSSTGGVLLGQVHHDCCCFTWIYYHQAGFMTILILQEMSLLSYLYLTYNYYTSARQ